MSQSSDPLAQRAALCKSLGFSNEIEAYRFIAGCAKAQDSAKLLGRGLTAARLSALGYDGIGMKRLGCSDATLQQLGYGAKAVEPPPAAGLPPSAEPAPSQGEPPPAGSPDHLNAVQIRQLLASGLRAPELKLRGVTLHHLKRAECPYCDIERAGFQIEELAQVYSAAELRRQGCGVRELRRLFNGQELRNAGFSAADMRNAGYSIRDLISFGYNENHIRTAGYSLNELIREGMNRQTVDKRKFNR